MGRGGIGVKGFGAGGTGRSGSMRSKEVFAAARGVERRAKNQVMTATKPISKIIVRSVICITPFSFE